MAGFWHGVALVVGSLLVSFSALFALIGAKLLPQSENQILEFLRTDQYYSVVVPMSLPTVFVAVYASWLGLKLFRSA